jgi:hypothetical protein
MKKIVVLSRHAASEYRLITLLNALFPECEVEICNVSPDREVFETVSVASNSDEAMPP